MNSAIKKALLKLREQKSTRSAPLALVTGGSSGMGRVYVEQLAQYGCDLLVVSNQEELLNQTAAEVQAKYPVRVFAYYCDLAASEAAHNLMDYCQSNSLQVDILINNAGMYFFKELDYQQDAARVETILNLHVQTITRMTLLMGEQMKARGYGYILNVASMAAHLPVPGLTLYAATKAYLKSFSCSYYFEMQPYGVGVTTVCPAAIATPLYHFADRWMKWGLRLGIINTPEWLVKRALRALFKKRKIIRPGFLNRIVPAVIGLFPNQFVVWIWKKVK